MLITAVEPKKKGLSALYLDGEYAMKLDTETLLAHRFDVGREIDDETLHRCVIASDTKRCKDKAMWLVSLCDHSRRELYDKLRRDYDESVCEQTVARLQELGLIDDRRYAERYAADLVHLRHLSVRGVREKLYHKGIDRDLIDEVTDTLDIDESAQLRAIIEKKYARSLSDEKGVRRTVAALTRMGFGYADIRAALRDYTDTEEY